MCLSPTGNDSEVKCIQYWSCRHNLCETVDPNQTQLEFTKYRVILVNFIHQYKNKWSKIHSSSRSRIGYFCGLCLLHAWVFYSIWGFTKNLFNFKFLEFRQILKKFHIFRSSKSLPKITFFFYMTSTLF